MAPIIGITTEAEGDRLTLARAYVTAVERAGGVPLLLPCLPACVDAYLDLCDGVVLSGGGDPAMEPWGVATHPRARPIDQQRQAFETALLRRLDRLPEKPVLGICLGMQLMALNAGGSLEQHLPDVLATAGEHGGGAVHDISGDLGNGPVASHHHQAVTDGGALRAVAWARDGVIEAVRADGRPFYLGVQWHPEHTSDERLGRRIFQDLVTAAARRS